MARHRIDLLHSVASSAPLRAAAVQVVTIHDVNYALAPEGHTRGMSRGQRIVVPAAARSADRVIAVSEYSRTTAIATLGVAPDRIDAVPNGGGRRRGRATPEPELRARLALGEAPLILSLSARRPHKNLPRLLAAVARMETRPVPTLVLPGYRTVFEDELARQHASSESQTGSGSWAGSTIRTSRASTPRRACRLPSLAESFGLPVLEAMARGVPVACSDTSSLPEVGGDAVRYFDPLYVDSIAAALDDLLTDRSAAERLATAGRARAAQFTWERAARGTLATYARALPPCSSRRRGRGSG